MWPGDWLDANSASDVTPLSAAKLTQIKGGLQFNAAGHLGESLGAVLVHCRDERLLARLLLEHRDLF